MNCIHRCPRLYRKYTTKAPLPHLAKVARTASTPRAVKLRRRKQFGAVPKSGTDSTPEGLTPTEQARYTRLRATGALGTDRSSIKKPEQWVQEINARRSRIRGFRKTEREGVSETEVVGRKVYLPNIVFRLVRNQTAPGQPYNPYEATFRIPQSVTKTDVRSLLLAVYGVETTYIRTDNYISPLYRSKIGTSERRPYKTYKRAVVGLVDPFYYPHRMEDMPEKERQERAEWIEKHFSIQHTRNQVKEELLRATKGQGKASWKFNAPFATKRPHILRLVAERREKRESLVAGLVDGMKTLRERDEKFDYKKLKGLTSVPPPEQSDTSHSPSNK
jgi:large subunit ribosomal protein L23